MFEITWLVNSFLELEEARENRICNRRIERCIKDMRAKRGLDLEVVGSKDKLTSSRAYTMKVSLAEQDRGLCSAHQPRRFCAYGNSDRLAGPQPHPRFDNREIQ
jgi:hypothetical protein